MPTARRPLRNVRRPGHALLLGLVLGLLGAACGPTPAPVVPEGAPPPPAEGPTDGGPAALGGVTDLAGIWAVVTDAVDDDPAAGVGSFAGYRIDEELADLGAITAVGRTSEVTGTVTVDAGGIADVEVVVPRLATLTSDRASRDRRVADLLADLGATFRSEGVPIDDVPVVGDRLRLEVPGALTIGGTTVPVLALLTVAVEGQEVVVRGTIATTLSAFGLEAPRAPIVLSVSDELTIEVQLHLRRA